MLRDDVVSKFIAKIMYLEKLKNLIIQNKESVLFMVGIILRA